MIQLAPDNNSVGQSISYENGIDWPIQSQASNNPYSNGWPEYHSRMRAISFDCQVHYNRMPAALIHPIPSH